MQSTKLAAVRMVLIAIVAAAALTVTAAPAATAAARPTLTTHTACFLPKTRFLLHAGLAFGAFHRYLWKPYQAGSFTGPDKIKTIAKAALASLFIYHEVQQALKEVQCSHALQVLASPFTAFEATIKAAADTLKSGGLPDIASLGKSLDAIKQQAAKAGAGIIAIDHTIP